jgi:hypothetical protein
MTGDEMMMKARISQSAADEIVLDVCPVRGKPPLNAQPGLISHNTRVGMFTSQKARHRGNRPEITPERNFIARKRIHPGLSTYSQKQIVATRQTAARKFHSSLSQRVAMRRKSLILPIMRSMALQARYR